MKKGIIFDMDGTLWDSSSGVADSWTEVVSKEYDPELVITREKIQSVMGLPMDKLAEAVFPDLEYDKRMLLLDHCCAAENSYLEKNGGILYPDVETTLIKLKEKYHLYIVSNCQSGYIEAFLSYYDFEKYFDDIECYGNNNLIKGDNIKLIVYRNNLDRAVYVGDIEGDYISSVEAGIEFIHAAYGFGNVEESVPRISKFSELQEVASNVLDASDN